MAMSSGFWSSSPGHAASGDATCTVSSRWGDNYHHIHFKCAKGGLKDNDRAVNYWLLLGVRIALDKTKNGQLSCVLKMVTENRDSTVESRGRYSSVDGRWVRGERWKNGLVRRVERGEKQMD